MSVEAFEEGVDDYLVEPFAARELVARVAGAIKLIDLNAISVEGFLPPTTGAWMDMDPN